jgi:hypothetical protein
MSRRVSDLVTRPTRGLGDQTARSADGQRIADAAAAGMDLTPLVGKVEEQVSEAQATRQAVEQMGKSFEKLSSRMASVAALAELRDR